MAYMDLFDEKAKALACRCLDYYDGRSKEHLIKFLQTYRKYALGKGLIPRTRNLTKKIADKSGLLFNGKPPMVEVYPVDDAPSPDDALSAQLHELFESARWVEFFSNFDPTVRLLKTAWVLVQYAPEKDRWVMDTMTQANAAVSVDLFGDLEVLLYETGKVDDYRTFKVWTPLEVFDLYVDKAGNEEKRDALPNPYGVIPAAVFYDTNVPRSGAWNPIPEDLIEVNDMYNLHITDSEYTASWNKQPTLFTNAQIQGGTGTQYVEKQVYGEPLPRWVPSSAPGFVGGPGTVVGIETNGEQVYLEYKKPDVDLMPLDDIMSKWVADYADDWSVNIKLDGQGSAADSGFKLVVEELPNLELRKARQRMFEAGFERLFEVIKNVGAYHGVTFPPEAVVDVTFSTPDLPVDEKASEEVWSIRISEGRASRVDYFMATKGLSLEEAEAKVAEIDAYGDKPAPVAPPITPVV